ncbi:uncharacterized protein A4U43_C02F17880 [Asparagus officinalis]|uniref:Uncharacterized protein n=1 Tax=Asparagus officinalis TaxID=4686 RepID=A0A5P1FJV2_ASPOF|nr:uncharacterized protein A4U43_C02F17880 [Asparagus officinalis]
MAPRSKASAQKKKVSDASSSTAAPGHDPELKPLDSANLQIHMEELEGAVKWAISARHTLFNETHRSRVAYKQAGESAAGKLGVRSGLTLGFDSS